METYLTWGIYKDDMATEPINFDGAMFYNKEPVKFWLTPPPIPLSK